MFKCSALWWGIWLLVAGRVGAAPPVGYPSSVQTEGQVLAWQEQESWVGYGAPGSWNLTGIPEFNVWSLYNGGSMLGTYSYQDNVWTGDGPVITNIPEPAAMQIVGVAGFFLRSSRVVRRRCASACPRRCWLSVWRWRSGSCAGFGVV